MFNEEKIKSFSTTDMRIYNYILKHSIQFPYMSIRELADEIPTSTASIMRFVKRMGYDSFPELKYAYKKEEKEVSLYMVNDLDETIDCLKKFNTPYYQDLFKEIAISLVLLSSVTTSICSRVSVSVWSFFSKSRSV